MFVGLILLSLLLVAVALWPFAQALFLAAIFATLLSGVQATLTRWLGGRPTLAAALLCVVVTGLVLGPAASLVAYVVSEAVAGAQAVAATVRQEGLGGLVERLPSAMQGTAQRLMAHLHLGEAQLSAALQQQLSERGEDAARVVGRAVSATGTLLVQGVMMLVALFFLLVDGERLVAWLEEMSPLEPGQTADLLGEFRDVSRAIIVSTVATAGVQSLLAFASFVVAGVPNAVFFGLLTFFTAFIPAVGAGGMCLVAAAVLFFGGHPWAAAGVAVWGLTVVGLVDNLVKPLLARRGMSLHPALIFFSILGGLSAFGGVGLLLGPLLMATFLALLRIYRRDYGRQPRAEVSTPSAAQGVGELQELADGVPVAGGRGDAQAEPAQSGG
ncbi:MAG: AI-2E family transporter [Myxococcaceae bacterium]|nr:AI-2E family transporter [Myxococcaceae bacterium]